MSKRKGGYQPTKGFPKNTRPPLGPSSVYRPDDRNKDTIKDSRMNWHEWDENDLSTLPPVEEEGVSTVSVLLTNGEHIVEAYFALDNLYWYSDITGYIIPDILTPPTHWAYMPDLP